MLFLNAVCTQWYPHEIGRFIVSEQHGAKQDDVST